MLKGATVQMHKHLVRCVCMQAPELLKLSNCRGTCVKASIWVCVNKCGFGGGGTGGERWGRTCMHISMEGFAAQHTPKPSVKSCNKRLLWVCRGYASDGSQVSKRHTMQALHC